MAYNPDKVKYPIGFFAKNPKTCALCGEQFFVTCSRQFDKQKYCSTPCMGKMLIGNKRQSNRSFRDARKCRTCGIDFIATQKTTRHCSRKCHDITHGQRYLIKNNSLKFRIKTLLSGAKGARSLLSVEFLLAMYEKQNGCCALTGQRMTWEVCKGRVPTNLSIDRISSFGGYTEDNVQLVCDAINRMKCRWSQSEFIDICRRVVAKADCL